MKSPLTWFMSRLGYVPAAAVDALRANFEKTVAVAMEMASSHAKLILATHDYQRAVELSKPSPGETQLLILAELRKQTTLLEVLAKQGEHMWQYVSESSDPLRTIDEVAATAACRVHAGARITTAPTSERYEAPFTGGHAAAPATVAAASGLPG